MGERFDLVCGNEMIVTGRRSIESIMRYVAEHKMELVGKTMVVRSQDTNFECEITTETTTQEVVGTWKSVNRFI